VGEVYNIYCDESCHLLHDQSPIMVLGAVWCLKTRVPEISQRVAQIKNHHHLRPSWECKWTKVSPQKLQFYLDLVDFLFDDDDIHFRGILITGKDSLDHPAWSQTHDEWYYKMLFRMLDVILDPKEKYRIYIDIKDARAAAKARKLREVLCTAKYDFDQQMVGWVQPIRSHESALMQLADLIVGAVAYRNRNLKTSTAKQAIVERIQERSDTTLTRSTFLGARKFNLFRWQPKDSA